MNIFPSTILTIIFLTKIINSLPGKLTKEQSDRLLISLKTPIWFSEGESDGKSFKYSRVHPGALHNAIKFYENPENMADYDFKRDTYNNWYFTKQIGNFSDESKEKLEKLRELWGQLFYDSETQWNSRKSKRNVKRATNENESGRITRRPKYTLPVYDGPDPIYPRILLYVNYLDMYFTSDRELRFYKLLIYLISFWNGVEMKFTEFEYPRIKFHIAGIVIGNNKWSAPWLQTSKSLNPQYKEALDNFGSYVVQNDPLPGRWDIFIDQTNITFTQKIEDLIPIVTGMARMGTTCNIHPNIENHFKAIIITDNLLFSGIDIAAHEIGHALGVVHDGVDGALCDDYQFIMSPVSPTKSSPVVTWSWCSKFQILQHLRNYTKECWQNKPIVNKIDEVPEILPGQFVNPVSQCDSKGFNNISNEDSIDCDHLYCKNDLILFGISLFGICDDTGPPLDGTLCGNNRRCKNKKCI